MRLWLRALPAMNPPDGRGERMSRLPSFSASPFLKVGASLVLGAVFSLAFRFPASSGWGWFESLMALAFPVLLLDTLYKGRHAFWIWLALFAGLVGIFHWVPSTLALKGGLPMPVALLGGTLFWGWEALGFLLVALLSRWGLRGRGPWAAALMAAAGIALWERFGFHIYAWSWGAPFGGVPWLARSAAFVGSTGLSALAWGCGAWLAAALSVGYAPRRAFSAHLGLAGLFLLLGGGWYLLPRGPERQLDVVMVQPNFEPGLRMSGMETACWERTDAALAHHGLPGAGRRCLVLWPESAVLGRDDRHPDPRLSGEAARRGVAWLYGTEGGQLNLVRGEVDGRPTFLLAKVELMAFGERMPGPDWMRRTLDEALGMVSQVPGKLGPGCSFVLPTPQGAVKVHPLVCSEGLLADRVQAGLAQGGGDLLANLTNDGWFERSIATDLHAAQIRLRAVETGLPLLRATLTGKSGLFREDGTWALWGEARSEGEHVFTLVWRPVWTPARFAGWTWALLALLVAGGLCTAIIRFDATP